MMTKSPFGSERKDFHYLGELLGEGGFATVHKAECLQPGVKGLIVAIKEISKEQVQRKKLTNRIRQELAIHLQLQHPSIVKLHTTFEDDENYYLVLEYCENGTLAKYLKLRGRLQEKEAHDIIKQVLEGLQYLHSKNVIHRDLSLGNILMTKDMQIKIADFGLSTKLSRRDEKKFTMLGTADFMSPELMQKGSGHGMEVDIWALGCVLFALLVGKPPFNSGTVGEIFKKATMSDVKIPTYVSKEAMELIYALIQKNPKHRIDLNGALRSSFFAKYKTNPPGRQKYDSGIGQTSSSTTRSTRSSYRSTGTSDSGMGVSGNRDALKSPGSSRDVVCMSTIHSMSRSYHSCDQLHVGYNYDSGGQVQSCPKSPPSKLKKSQREMESRKQLKNKLLMLPSRKEFHNPPSLEVSLSGRGRERSASEERHKQERQKILHDSTEYFHRQSKEQIDMNAVLYYKHQDYQIRSHPQSPMPYPIKHLENIIDENLRKSYSSCENRNPSKSDISRDTVDTCQKRQHLVQKYDNSSHHSWEHHSATHAKSNKKKSLVHEKPLPFNTARLEPRRYVNKDVAVISILSDGQVCLELLNRKTHGKYVSSVCFISPDGMRIFLYKTNTQFPVSDKPPRPENLTDLQCFNYESLPKLHWKKYSLASCFVKYFKASRPKISIYSKQGRFMMMENEPPDFRMTFFNGGKITEVSGKIHVVNKDGKVIGSLDEDYQIMREEYDILKSRCEALTIALESLQADDPEGSFFPATIGKKPSPLNQVIGNENITTSPSIRSSTLSKAFANIQCYPHSAWSPLENSRNTTSSPSENSKKYIKNQCEENNVSKSPYLFKNRSIEEILANLTSLPRVVDGKIVAEYKDGFEMWSTRIGDEVYFYDKRSGRRHTDVTPGTDLFNRLCNDLKGILLHIEERRNMR